MIAQIIVYSSPLSKWYWESGVGYVVTAAIALAVAGFIGWLIYATHREEKERNERFK